MKFVLLAFATLLTFSSETLAYESIPLPASAKPAQLEGVGITEKLGTQIDLNLEFKDEEGKAVSLRNFMNGSKPVLLGLVYYGCPNLCNFFLNGVTDVLKNFPWTPGKEFEVVMVSIDPKENSELARKKKENYLKAYGRVETRNGWHFLTGDEANIKALSSQVGFSFRWDPQSKEWAHASAAIITTPFGQVSRYLYGIMFEQQTLRLSLVEAGKSKVGGFMDRVLLFCYKFDPARNKYSLYAMNLMRVAAALTAIIMGIFLYSYWKRNRLLKGDSTV